MKKEFLPILYKIKEWCEDHIEAIEYEPPPPPVHTVMTKYEMAIHNFRLNVEKQMFQEPDEDMVYTGLGGSE